MKRNIIVIDDFYKNPNNVREFALNSDYPKPSENYTYPGKNSKENWYSEKIHNKFESILNRKLIPAENNGYFRISLSGDSFIQDIHVDPVWEFGAVCYLNPDYQTIDEGGTSFWIHKKTMSDYLPLTDIEAKCFNFSSTIEMWNTTVYGEGLNRDKWIRYFLCPNKFNRIIVFRTNLWHSHNYNFGDCLENGRLVQLFFFNPINYF